MALILPQVRCRYYNCFLLAESNRNELPCLCTSEAIHIPTENYSKVSGMVFSNSGLVKFRNCHVCDSANLHNLVSQKGPGIMSTSLGSHLVSWVSEVRHHYCSGIQWSQWPFQTCGLICFTARASAWCGCQWILHTPVVLGWCQRSVGQVSSVVSIPLCLSRGYQQFTFCCYHQLDLSHFYHPSSFWLVQCQRV